MRQALRQFLGKTGDVSEPRHVPSIFLLVPGPWVYERQLRELMPPEVAVGEFDEVRLEEGAARVMLVQDLDGFGDALQWSRSGPANAAMVQAAEQSPSAALLEYGAALHHAGQPLAELVKLLRDAGGVGVRVEASGASMTWADWDTAISDPTASALVWHSTLIFNDGDMVFSNGMHAFQRPDAQVVANDAQLLGVLNSYQVSDDPAFATGHTFSTGPDAPVWAFERWPDHRHSIADGRHNPFGIWHLIEPDVALAAIDPVPMIMPSLTALLSAAETEAGRPLVADEVREIANEASAIALDLADAITMERSRGFADIEPRLAWEQWQIVRESL